MIFTPKSFNGHPKQKQKKAQMSDAATTSDSSVDDKKKKKEHKKEKHKDEDGHKDEHKDKEKKKSSKSEEKRNIARDYSFPNVELGRSVLHGVRFLVLVAVFFSFFVAEACVRSCVCALRRGAFSVVHLAKHKESGEDVAVKVINKKDLGADYQKNLDREIEILTKIKHPGIIAMRDLVCLYVCVCVCMCASAFATRSDDNTRAQYETKHEMYIVMELVDGRFFYFYYLFRFGRELTS